MRVSSILTPTAKTNRTRISIGLAALALAAPLAIAQGLSDKVTAKQTFSAPIIAGASERDPKVTSKYGLRKNPFSGENAWHTGTDVGASTGTPLAAPARGEIIFAGTKLDHNGNPSGYGNLIDLKLSASGDVIRYSQLSKINVRVGDTVSAGDIVGLVGSSGRSTGPHLHLEYHVDGKPHDPQEIDGLVLFEGR